MHPRKARWAHFNKKGSWKATVLSSIQMSSLSQPACGPGPRFCSVFCLGFKPEIPIRSHESHVLKLNVFVNFLCRESELWTNCRVSSHHKNVDPKTQNYGHLNGVVWSCLQPFACFFPSLLCGLQFVAGCNLYSLDRKTENDRVLHKPLCLNHG